MIPTFLAIVAAAQPIQLSTRVSAYQGPANAAPLLPAGVRTWDSTRYGGRLHVVDADGKAHVAPTRADQFPLGKICLVETERRTSEI